MRWQPGRLLDALSHWQTWLPSILATLWVAGLCWLQLLHPFENLAYQWLFQWRGPLTWDDRVVLVKIDEPSLRQLGTFPWSRDRYTQLLNILEIAQPNAVIFDLVFAESSFADQLFAAAIQQHRQVVLASTWDALIGAWQPNSNQALPQAAIATGHILHTPDSDGLVRCIPTWVDQIPSLSLLGLQTYRLFAAAPEPPANQLQLCPNWIAPSDRLPQYSFVDILNGQIQPTQLSHKIILVGATAAGLNSLITPFDQSPPANGVHLQATLLNNLLQQNLLRPVHGPLWLGGLLLSNLIWGALLRPLRIVHQLCWTSILLVGWWCIAVAALGQHYWLPVALPIGLWLSTTVIHGLMANRQLEAKTRRLHYLANIDELTQVSNRRAFEQYLQREWQRSLREQQPISLILGDVDFFKQFNDYYGHLAGDTCLYQVAQLLQSSTKRPTDMVARYGGEEFAIILPNTDAAGAQKLATLILGQMRAQLIPHPASEISHYVTLSLGSATAIPNRQIDWYNLVDVADRALYAAKFQGRDRACSETLNRDPSNGATEAAIVTV